MLGRDGVAGLACLAGSLWLLALTRGLPQPALVPVGPGFYPRIVLTVTAVLSAVLVAVDLLARRRARGGAGAAAAPAGVPRNARLVAVTFAVFAGYVVIMPLVGFRPCTAFFVLALQAALEPEPRRHWLRIVLVAAITAWLTHLVFEGYLSVLLPRGRWTGF
jgi:putative tricarboxylic transport membrane protein